MSDTEYPIEHSFATGSRGELLVLMVCATWIWAGLYASPYAKTPLEVFASATRTARVHGRELCIGAGTFALAPRSLQSAWRWLDRQGVSVRHHRGDQRRSKRPSTQ